MKLAVPMSALALVSMALSGCEAAKTSEVVTSEPIAVAADAGSAIDEVYGRIPGPRDCFWARGPHSADPYINGAYPDANVFQLTSSAITYAKYHGSLLRLIVKDSGALGHTNSAADKYGVTRLNNLCIFEENNFGVRKRLLEYDDVMNSQREVVYKRRHHALFGERLRVDLANMIYDTSEGIAETNKGANDYKNFEFELIRYFYGTYQYSISNN